MLLLLLLLLLLELLLVLLGNRRHWRHGTLLRSLAEAGKLRLQLSRALLRLQPRVAGVLLLERCLTKPGRLRGERTRLGLLRLLLLRLASACAERAAILGSAGAHGIAPEERVRVGIHDAGGAEVARSETWSRRRVTGKGAGGGRRKRNADRWVATLRDLRRKSRESEQKVD